MGVGSDRPRFDRQVRRQGIPARIPRCGPALRRGCAEAPPCGEIRVRPFTAKRPENLASCARRHGAGATPRLPHRPGILFDELGSCERRVAAMPPKDVKRVCRLELQAANIDWVEPRAPVASTIHVPATKARPHAYANALEAGKATMIVVPGYGSEPRLRQARRGRDHERKEGVIFFWGTRCWMAISM